jgi:hypothetical protein
VRPGRRVVSKGELFDAIVVSNDTGSSTLTQTVIVTEAALQADFDIPASPIVGKPITFTDRSKGKPELWQWILDGMTIAQTPSCTTTIYQGGEHVMELRVTQGSEQSIRVRPFQVFGPPIAAFRTTGSLVTGAPATFIDTSGGTPTELNGAGIEWGQVST